MILVAKHKMVEHLVDLKREQEQEIIKKSLPKIIFLPKGPEA